jgi:ABC-type transport system substrate-binding protein
MRFSSRRRTLLAASLAAAASPALGQATSSAPRVLRYAFRVAETSFDPAYITDFYSRTVAAALFDAPLEYEFLASPTRMRPNTAEAMPEVSDDFRSFTFRIRPGIFFADDPAFKGARRELTAHDYVYSLKRHYDPRWKSGNLYLLEADKILGLSELRREALKTKTPFDYQREVEGLRALDRYTFQVKLADPKPRFLQHFTDGSFTGAVAREVVEAYGDKVGDHPVGTGPFVIKEWKRSSRLVLARNPNFRDKRYDEHPPEGNARLQAIAKAFNGRRLPLLDEVHIAIIEEAQPRWLSFLNEEHDLADIVPEEFVSVAAPNDQLAPNLARRGIHMERYPRADVAVSYFAMEDPVVGGYEPHKVALRRAMALGVDVDREIRLVRRGQAIAAQGPLAPQAWGYDPDFRSTMGEFDPRAPRRCSTCTATSTATATAGASSPTASRWSSPTTRRPSSSRQLAELWQKNMADIGIRMAFKTAKWPENLKASRAGKLHDVGRGLGRRRARRRHLPGAGLRPQQGPGQPCALRPAGLQPPVRTPAHAARRPRAPAADDRSRPPDGGLHALQGSRAPHLHRPGPPLGAGLPPQHLRARLLPLHRRRPAAPGGGHRAPHMKRRDTLKLGAALALPAGTVHADAQGRKVLRVVFPVAETGFDPARVSDIYSATVNAHIFESLLRYDHLTRPVAVRTRTAAALPEHSDDFRVWTVRIRPGIFFADDPAFKGARRELTAHDYVYTAKRFADPATKSPNWPSVHEWRLLGLAELRDKALKDKTPFDYDTPIEGLRALDRYTVQFTLQRPQPRFAYQLAVTATFGALAREVVEAYGDKIMEHPVGTGPYRLAQWRRSSFIALERNPNYREHVYDAQPAADDAEGQAIAQRMKGQRLPVVDRVEISIIEEAQPRWLSFLNGQSDLAAVPQEFVPVAMPGGKLAPNLAKKGIQGWRVLMPFTQLTFFNMDHPLVGGYEPHKVALRRAVFLALDSQREIDLVFRGQAIPAQGIVGPHCFGWTRQLQDRERRRRRAACQGAARPVRLGRPQRRRLA